MIAVDGAPQRILIVRPSALGDVCRTVPALVSLRARYPDATIDWLVRDVFAPAVAAHPGLSGVVHFPRATFATAWRSPAAAGALVSWLRGLSRAKYDVVYDLQGLLRSAMFALATGAPRRVGRSPSREMAFLGLNVRHRVPRDAHDVDATLALLRADGVPPIPDMRLYTPLDARRLLPADAARAIEQGERIVVLAPTSRWPGKRWPVDRFAQVALTILKSGAAERVAVVGARGEEKQCAPLLALAEQDQRVVNLVGRTGVGELMAVIEASSLVIANDSAALHMAVGFDRPLVALFGPTRIARVGPFGRDADVLQHLSPGDTLDHKNASTGLTLMRRITVEEVVSAALARLDRGPREPKGSVARTGSTIPADVAAAR